MRSCPQVLSERLGAGQTLGESGRRLYSLWWLSHPRALGWLLPIPDKNLHLRLFVLGFHFSVYKKEGNRVKGTGMEVRVLSKYLVYKFWLKLMNVSHHNKHQIKSKGEKTWLFILLTCISLLGIYATGIPLQGRNGIQIRSSTARRAKGNKWMSTPKGVAKHQSRVPGNGMQHLQRMRQLFVGWHCRCSKTWC